MPHAVDREPGGRVFDSRRAIAVSHVRRCRVTARSSPTVRRRRLGMELRRLREQAGITIDTVAERLDFSASKVSRIETGQTGASATDVQSMLTLYGVTGPTAEDLVQVAREARVRGWWLRYGHVLTGAYVGLEAGANSICAYEAQLVPGLMQTEDYARRVIRATRPLISDEELDSRIYIRTVRQSLLDRDEPIDFWAVLDEAVFHRMVGNPSIMRTQLEKLVAVSDRPNVTIQVLPFAVGAHIGMDGTFAILEYEEVADPDIVFAENAAGGLLLEKDDELQRYKFIFDRLQSIALSPNDSVAFMAARAREFT
jgi:transcriptional regulator with XRE-family HTH domain